MESYISTVKIHHSTELKETIESWYAELNELIGDQNPNVGHTTSNQYNPVVADDDLPDFAKLRRLKELKKGGE